MSAEGDDYTQRRDVYCLGATRCLFTVNPEIIVHTVIPAGYPAFICTIDLDPRRLFETRRLIETRCLFGYLRYME